MHKFFDVSSGFSVENEFKVMGVNWNCLHSEDGSLSVEECSSLQYSDGSSLGDLNWGEAV